MNKAEFEQYRKWSKSQKCVNCGKEKDGKELWATEIQCAVCLEKHGTTESQGLGSAAEHFRAA